jgi:hypothetical protein
MNLRLVNSKSRIRMLVIQILFCSLIGCGDSVPAREVVFPVGGQLKIQKAPAVGAVVTFHRMIDGSPEKSIEAVVLADGQFRAVQPDGANGLPEGEYLLTAHLPGETGDQWGGRYSDPSKPLSRITVKPTVNLIPPIQLKP